LSGAFLVVDFDVFFAGAFLTGASILLALEVAAETRPSAGRALEVGVTKNLSLTGTDCIGWGGA
jgi:hypothetical protein